MNRRRLLALGALLPIVAACSAFGPSEVCNCPTEGPVLITVCGAIASATLDPNSICTLTQTQLSQAQGLLYVQSHVVGTCHVEVTFTSGATASTAVTITSVSEGSCCGQMLTETAADTSLGCDPGDASMLDPRCPATWSESTCGTPCPAVGLACDYPAEGDALFCRAPVTSGDAGADADDGGGEAGEPVWACGV